MTAEATSDRRTRQRHERRDRLFQAAVELFAERGYENTTMEDIAERADTARATVFNHFQRKTAFLDEWSLRRRERAMTAVRAENLEDRPLREVLSRYLIELARNSLDSRAETVACMGAAIHSTNVFGNPELARQFGAFVARAQETGEIRPDIDPAQAGLLLATAYFGTLSSWIESEAAPFDLQAHLLHMLEMILRGIAVR
ncbi:TetR/AcrR family transcriptional regulator [Amycolatopsis sp. FU40]|uniref:TetR/AcrR family transcriptional regulator n=1 Tax=Amycolatopsis sp. FU40 TaxID=2914159 RepID=UPI001F2451C1|nr:TetR/AcrR family transcriptional regulator [Amycolatopsis sp. FU40]UKD52350.1 TetR/AcrR family transcriptional regulator [Amycolatopsis sp. FU40]